MGGLGGPKLVRRLADERLGQRSERLAEVAAEILRELHVAHRRLDAVVSRTSQHLGDVDARHREPRDPGVAAASEVALDVRARRLVKLRAFDLRDPEVRPELLGEVVFPERGEASDDEIRRALPLAHALQQRA